MMHCAIRLIIGFLAAGLVVARSGLPMDERDEKEAYLPLVLDWALDRGTWGPQEFCPRGSFAYAFRIKLMAAGIVHDDTSMNGIELFCREPANEGRDGQPPRKETREFSITSNYAQWGTWRDKKECPEGFLTGLKMKSQEDQGIVFDDTAANDLEMQCDHTTTTINAGGNKWGYYSSWATCPEGWAICGLQTKVEAEGVIDDTALNNVKMFCCQMTPLNQPHV